MTTIKGGTRRTSTMPNKAGPGINLDAGSAQAAELAALAADGTNRSGGKSIRDGPADESELAYLRSEVAHMKEMLQAQSLKLQQLANNSA